jgi:gustatory receptor
MLPMFIEMFLLDDVEKIVKLFYISLTEIGLFAKYLTLVFKNKRIRRALEISNLAENQPKFTDDIYDAIQQDNKVFTYIAIFFYNSVIICIVTSVFGPLFLKGYNLPFFTWYFNLDWHKTDQRYWIFYIYQSVGMTMHALTNTAVDVTYPYLLNFARTEICILNSRILNMNKNNKTYKNELLDNIKFHQWIIEYCKEIESIFSEVMFLQFCLSGFVLCFTAFQITIVSIGETPIK